MFSSELVLLANCFAENQPKGSREIPSHRPPLSLERNAQSCTELSCSPSGEEQPRQGATWLRSSDCNGEVGLRHLLAPSAPPKSQHRAQEARFSSKTLNPSSC